MTYTNISKPSGTSYTNTNAVGKQQYDQASITYDDASIFYDGVNQAAYTSVSKPLTSDMLWQDADFAWSSATFPWLAGSGYTKVSKPI